MQSIGIRCSDFIKIKIYGLITIALIIYNPGHKPQTASCGTYLNRGKSEFGLRPANSLWIRLGNIFGVSRNETNVDFCSPRNLSSNLVSKLSVTAWDVPENLGHFPKAFQQLPRSAFAFLTCFAMLFT